MDDSVFVKGHSHDAPEMSADADPPSFPGYIHPRFIDAVVLVNGTLRNSGAVWSIGGDLADAMREVDVRPESVELFTDEGGASKIHNAVRGYKPTELKVVEQRLPRDAEIEGAKRPVFIRSHFFEFAVGGVDFSVHGDMQYKVGDWEWGDALDFIPEEINIVGEKFSIVPLVFRIDLYRGLGWTDRADAITRAIARTLGH